MKSWDLSFWGSAQSIGLTKSHLQNVLDSAFQNIAI